MTICFKYGWATGGQFIVLICINDTAVMKRVNMKKGDMILVMGRCLKNVLIDGGRNAARLRYLRFLWVMLGQ